MALNMRTKRKMRFRAWNGIDCRMEVPDWIENTGYGYAGTGWECWNESHRNWIVMQFTGMIDRNGKGIFEGDIVYDDTVYQVVEWTQYACNAAGWLLQKAPAELEVAGNVYEHPELIPASAKHD